MYFEAPPDGAARALLDDGAASQRRIIHSSSKSKDASRPIGERCVHSLRGVGSGDVVKQGQQPKSGGKYAQNQPSSHTQIPATQVEAEQDELTAINDRVEKVIQNYDRIGMELQYESTGGDSIIFDATDFDTLKGDIQKLLGKQEDLGSVRTMALETVVDVMGGYDQQEGDEASGEDATGEARVTGAHPQDDPEIDNLVGAATENQRKKVSKLDHVHKQSSAMRKDMELKMKRLQRAFDEKEEEVISSRKQIVGLEERCRENEARYDDMRSELKQVHEATGAQISKLAQELQAERDKPPPPPPLIEKADLDALRFAYEKTRRELMEAQEAVILSGEQLKEAQSVSASLSVQLKAQKDKCSATELQLAQVKSNHEVELAKQAEARAELQRKLQTTADSLETMEDIARRAREDALRDSKDTIRRLKESLEHAQEEMVARAAEVDARAQAEQAKMRADFERMINKTVMEAAEAKEALRAEQESRQTLIDEQLRERPFPPEGEMVDGAQLEALRAKYEQDLHAARAKYEQDLHDTRVELEASISKGMETHRRKSLQDEQLNSLQEGRTSALQATIEQMEAEIHGLKSQLKAALLELEEEKKRSKELKESMERMLKEHTKSESVDAATKLQAAARGRSQRAPPSLVGFKKVDRVRASRKTSQWKRDS
jgi:hypothetical protein